jgi:hypothetical protein
LSRWGEAFLHNHRSNYEQEGADLQTCPVIKESRQKTFEPNTMAKDNAALS